MAEVKDVSPGLLKAVKGSFDKKFSGSKRITKLYDKIQDGTATYAEANQFAIEVGEMLAQSFQSVLSEDVLPDQRMYYNIAKSIVEPMMVNNYDLVVDFAGKVQKRLNEAASISIKAIKPELNQDRIDGIINRLSTAERYNDISWILKEPIVNFSQSIVDDSIRANAEFQYDSGLSPRIERTSTGKCCDWCNEIVGKYEYPDVPKDVYRRHSYCRCKVDYIAGKYRKNVHNNNSGKRRYVQDKYGNYVQTKEARVERAGQMKATEKARKERARQKRIETWNKKKSAKNVEISSDNDIIKSGAVSGARNPDGEKAREHAVRYYGLVRSMTTDVKKIAKTTGFPEEKILEIKRFIFYEKHDLGGPEKEYFEPDYMMAESWRRLIDGTPEKHDIVMIEHEALERRLMLDGMSQRDAHILASKKYNYGREARAFYDRIEKYSD